MNFTEDQRNTLQLALYSWGKEDQLAMAVGECGEFITLVGRRAQKRDTPEDWISEIADNIILMEQMAHLFGYDEVKQMVEYKINRTKNKLDSTILYKFDEKVFTPAYSPYYDKYKDHIFYIDHLADDGEHAWIKCKTDPSISVNFYVELDCLIRV
jgi:hypothetical protein